MNVESIRSRATAEDFKPFALITFSGHKYPVPHPDFLFLTQRTVIVADNRGYVINIDPLHVVGLEDIPPGKNGRGKRRKYQA